jgi:type II secretory pathway pseudopilin PulG
MRHLMPPAWRTARQSPATRRRRQSVGHRSRQSGVTLISLMIGMLVGILVLTGTLSVYLLIVKGARENIQQARLNQELRAALEVMQQDIRRAGYWDFADTNQDGDSNADGVLTWSDLGVNAGGSGTFDTNGDGATDALDLHPVNNPFQRQYGPINNDLCIGTDSGTGACVAEHCTATNATGDCLTGIQTGSCITYTYDLDQDGRIGVRSCDLDAAAADCPRPAGAPFNAANHEPYAWRPWYPPAEADKTKAIAMEMFGYRLRGGRIDMRVGWSNSGDVSFGCDSGSWEGITSSEITIAHLEFTLTTLLRNANPAKSRTDTCATGDLCQRIRSVGITLAGHLAQDDSTRQTLSALVAVRNDRYLQAP